MSLQQRGHLRLDGAGWDSATDLYGMKAARGRQRAPDVAGSIEDMANVSLAFGTGWRAHTDHRDLRALHCLGGFQRGAQVSLPRDLGDESLQSLFGHRRMPVVKYAHFERRDIHPAHL